MEEKYQEILKAMKEYKPHSRNSLSWLRMQSEVVDFMVEDKSTKILEKQILSDFNI